MLPPPSQLQPIVNDITEWLAMLASGHMTQPPRTWSPTEWRYARAIAHVQGIAPLLHAHGAGALGDAEWHAFLAQQHERNTLRNRSILALFDGMQSAAVRRGVALLPLKGVSFITWLYDDIGLRPMADIDLFTPADHEPVAREVIEAVGFGMVDRMDRHGVFVLPPNTIVDLRGEHPDNPIKLELHTRLYDNVPREEYDLTPLFARRCKSVPAMPPSLTDVLMHALLHATVHMSKRSLRFITLNDLMLLSRRLTRAEWDEMRAALTQFGGAWWAYPPLRLMQHYFPDTLPDEMAHWLTTETTPRLRRAVPNMTIVDVSFCHLRPAYLHHLSLWSRDVREIAGYVAERLSGRGRMGWQTAHQFAKETYAFTPTQGPHRRLLRWFSPRTYRVGVEQLFGE